MQFLQSIALLATLALPNLALALPSPGPDVVVEVRASNSTAESDSILAAEDVTTAFMCTNANFGGTCSTFQLNTQTTCFNLQGTPQYKTVSSGRPASNAYYCRWWSSTACNGGSTSNIQYPGVADFSAIGFSGQAGSFKCYSN